MVYAVLASLGHQEVAMEKALALPEDVFTSAGGSGQSLTNTLWYISTRASPHVPYDLKDPSTSINSQVVTKSEKKKTIDCGCPDTCKSKVLKSNADGKTCKERIQWIMTNKGLNELGACSQVAGNDHKSECGACDPALCAGLDTTQTSGCPPCGAEVCKSKLNQCQITTTPYLCYDGTSSGGCSPTPWETSEGANCSACCEIFEGCEG